ncbi:MAG: CoA transferase [Burkholderiales bacterium]|nr:CoA transferase [Burkholderiales bacterium]
MTVSSPLEGVKVLDLTRALSGPFCTMILGDLGADVIKVEPIDGDMMRQWGPFDRTESVYYLTGNRNKRAIAIDFRSAEGIELIKEFAKECDVVVENFKPGSMDAMGLNYEKLAEINPRLIYMSITGFGRDGPNSDQPGFDQIAQGYSGLMSVTGSPESGPLRVGVAIGDQTTGMWAAIGVLSALAQREKTGVGHRIDTSLMASLVGLLSVQGQRYLSLGETPGLAGNNHPVVSPCGVFQTKDGPLNIAANTPNMWITLCNILDLNELVADERFIDNASRAVNRDELKQLIEKQLSRFDRQHWTHLFNKSGVPAGPINNLAEVFSDAQVLHCQLVEEVNHPVLGTLKLVGSPIQFDLNKGSSIKRAPPLLGEHTSEILEEFGWSHQEIDNLNKRGVVKILKK